MSKRKGEGREAAPRTSSAPAARVCPNCKGTAWGTRAVVVNKSEARDTAERQASIDAVIAARGDLEQCATCGYQAHAGDSLEPAQA